MKNIFLTALGFFSLALGIIGLFLPLIPTAPFVLLSAWCFMRSSPKFHKWLIEHRLFGPMIDAWVKKGAISMPTKIMTLIMTLFSLSTLWFFLEDLSLRIIVTVLLGSVVAFVFTRPSL